VIGATITDFASYRSTNREILKKQLEISEQADRELFATLRRFSDKATGKGTTTEDDAKKLREEVGKSFVAAERLSLRFPGMQPEFDQYSYVARGVAKNG